MSTYHSEYVLDDKNIDSDNFLERRVLMLGRKYRCRIYNLKYKCDSLIQVYKTYKELGYKKFIDSNGKIGTYKPTKLVRAEWKQCTSISSADGMFYATVAAGEPYHFVTKEPYKYICIISFRGGRHIIDTSNIKPDKEKIWRKI